MHVFPLAVLSRLATVCLALGFAWLFAPYDSSSLVTGSQSWLSPLANWDGVHLVDVARHGYRFEHSYAFFPGYPLLVRLLSKSFSLDAVTTAVLLSNVCFVLAAVVVSRLDGRNAALLFLISPASIFFSAAYTESLFALLVCVGCFFLEHRRHWSACAAFFACSVVRSNGAVLALLLLVRGEIVLAGLLGIPFFLQNFECALRFCVHDSQPWCSKANSSCVSFCC